MNDADLSLRNHTYRLFAELGRAPSVEQVAAVASFRVDDVVAGWLRLADDHAIVLQAGGRELRMASPFSAVTTNYRVLANDRWWYANCAWDAFGVCAALHVDGRIEFVCPDCGDPVTVHVCDGQPDDATLLFHCLVSAFHWWDDIVFI